MGDSQSNSSVSFFIMTGTVPATPAISVRSLSHVLPVSHRDYSVWFVFGSCLFCASRTRLAMKYEGAKLILFPVLLERLLHDPASS